MGKIKPMDLRLKCGIQTDPTGLHYCPHYDEYFSMINEYCSECLEYMRVVDNMLPKIKEALGLEDY